MSIASVFFTSSLNRAFPCSFPVETEKVLYHSGIPYLKRPELRLGLGGSVDFQWGWNLIKTHSTINPRRIRLAVDHHIRSSKNPSN